jgi:hypothetical protein
MADWCMAHPWMTFVLALFAIDALGGWSFVVRRARRE